MIGRIQRSRNWPTPWVRSFSVLIDRDLFGTARSGRLIITVSYAKLYAVRPELRRWIAAATLLIGLPTIAYAFGSLTHAVTPAREETD